jgi:hypothetical protein
VEELERKIDIAEMVIHRKYFFVKLTKTELPKKCSTFLRVKIQVFKPSLNNADYGFFKLQNI